jgi:hypothetical protein
MTGLIAIDGKAPVDFSPLGETLVATRTAIRNSDERRREPTSIRSTSS